MFNKKQQKELEELNNKMNQIETGTTITGDVETHGNFRLDGVVNGNLTCQAKVVLGTTGKIKGNIKAQNAEISGEILGGVEIADVLILRPSAIIHGDIITNKMVVESGASFNGSCKMGAVMKDIKLKNVEPAIAEKTA